jgi:Spy/CpxP family protein refolding chaperone
MTATATAMLVLLPFTVAWAQEAGPPTDSGRENPEGPPPRHGPPPIEHVLQRHAQRLALTPEVTAEIEAIAEASRSALDALHLEHRAAHDAMRALLSSPEPDEVAVMAQADVIADVDARMHKERLRAMLAIRRLLTAEQLAELVAIHEEERGQPGADRRGPPPGMGPPMGGPR